METGLVDRFTASAEEWTCECGRLNALDIVGREFEDSNFASGQVLLITNVLI